MPLSTQQKANYIRSINKLLDKIPFDTLTDFIEVQEALQNTLEPIVNYAYTGKYIKRMCSIETLILSPEKYVENPKDYEEFTQLIKSHIKAKIQQLRALGVAQQLAYIQELEIAENQQRRAEATLLASLRSFLPTQVLFPNAARNERHTRGRIGRTGGVGDYLDLPFNDRQIQNLDSHLFSNPLVYDAMSYSIFSLNDFLPLSPEQIENVGIALRSANCLRAIENGHTTIALLAAMDPNDLRTAVATNNYSRGPSLGMR